MPSFKPTCDARKRSNNASGIQLLNFVRARWLDGGVSEGKSVDEWPKCLVGNPPMATAF